MKILWYLMLLVLLLAAGLLVAGQVGLLSGNVPANLGVTGGRLSPPAKTPNSVSSQAALYIAPFSYSGDGGMAMARLASLLEKSERTVIVTRRPDYIHAQCSTALLKFTDDVGFWLDRQNNVIQIRSASRLGRSDFGVNRARLEAFRARFSP